MTGQTVQRIATEELRRDPEVVIIQNLKEMETIVREEVMRAEHATPSLVQVILTPFHKLITLTACSV